MAEIAKKQLISRNFSHLKSVRVTNSIINLLVFALCLLLFVSNWLSFISG